MANEPKHYGFIALATAIAIIFSGGIYWVTNSTDFFKSTFSAAIYESFDVKNISVQREQLGNVPVSTVTFDFTPPKSDGTRVNFQAFDRIQTDIRTSMRENNYLYMVDGSGEGLSYRFESVSPNDYNSDVFSKSFGEFTRLANSGDENRKIDYSASISEQGSRVFSLSVENIPSENRVDGNLQLDWQNLLNSINIKEDTTHNIELQTNGIVSLKARFFNRQELDRLREVDENMLNTWTTAAKSASKFGITNIAINLPANPESNRTTVMVTLAEEVEDKAGTVAQFLSSAADNPDMAIPSNYTISFIGEGEATPFTVVEATNRTE